MNPEILEKATRQVASSSTSGEKFFTQTIDNDVSEFDLFLDQDIEMNDVLEFRLLSMSTNWQTSPFLLKEDVEIPYTVTVHPVAFLNGKNQLSYGGKVKQVFENSDMVYQLIMYDCDQRTGTITIPKNTDFSNQLNGLYEIAKNFEKISPKDILENFANTGHSAWDTVFAMMGYCHAYFRVPEYPGRNFQYGGETIRLTNDFVKPTLTPVAYEGKLGLKTSQFVPLGLSVLSPQSVMTTEYDPNYVGFSESLQTAAKKPQLWAVGGIYIHVSLNFLNYHEGNFRWTIDDDPTYFYEASELNLSLINFSKLIGMLPDATFDRTFQEMVDNGKLNCSEVRSILRRLLETDNSVYHGFKFKYLRVWPNDWLSPAPLEIGYYYLGHFAPDGAYCIFDEMTDQNRFAAYGYWAQKALGRLPIEQTLTRAQFEERKAQRQPTIAVPRPLYENTYWEGVYDAITPAYFIFKYIQASGFPTRTNVLNRVFYNYASNLTIDTIFFPHLVPDYFVDTKSLKMKINDKVTSEMAVIGRTVLNGEEDDVVQFLTLTDMNMFGSYTLNSSYMTPITTVLWYQSDGVAERIPFEIGSLPPKLFLRMGYIIPAMTIQTIGATSVNSYSAANFSPIGFNVSNRQNMTLYVTPRLAHSRKISFLLTDAYDRQLSNISAFGFEKPRSLLTFSCILYPNSNSMLNPGFEREFPDFVPGPSAYDVGTFRRRRDKKKKRRRR